MIRRASRVAAAVLLGLAAPAGAAPAAGHAERIIHHAASLPPQIGPRTARVTIELFFVPGAYPSRSNIDLVEQLWASHPDDIRLVYRPVARGQLLVPIASLVAHQHDQFFEFLRTLPADRTVLRRDQILVLAARAGVPTQEVEAAWPRTDFQDVFEGNDLRRLLHGSHNLPEILVNGRPPGQALATMSGPDLAQLYRAGVDEAQALLDQGVAADQLMASFDRRALAVPDATAIVRAVIEDGDPESDGEDAPGRGGRTATTLLAAPLDLEGWPATAPRSSALPIVVLCNARSVSCARELRLATQLDRDFAGRVRVVWRPWFNLARPDVVNLSLLSDTAACATSLGTGWGWLESIVVRGAADRQPLGRIIDAALRETLLSPGDLAACQARVAGRTLRSILDARTAGIRVEPTVVIGGRSYPGGFGDLETLQQLVLGELGAGVLGRWAPERVHAPPPR